MPKVNDAHVLNEELLGLEQLLGHHNWTPYECLNVIKDVSMSYSLQIDFKVK